MVLCASPDLLCVCFLFTILYTYSCPSRKGIKTGFLSYLSLLKIEIKKKCYFYVIQKKELVRFISGSFIAVIIILTANSCKNKGEKNIDQGEIHYTIEYFGNMGSMREIMPKNMIVSFKDNKILFDISTFGNSGILNLTNPEEGIFDTYISLMTIRYFYAGKAGEILPGFEAMKGMEIRKTTKSGIICGFNCKSAEVTLPNDRNKKYEIWYTNEIKIKEPNASTPFREIDGVLMSFFFVIGTAEMHFTAETVYKKEISDRTFERRDKFVRISREDIDKFINKFVSL